MFKDENEFKNIVNKLNIDTKSNQKHRENLHRQILSVFNQNLQNLSADNTRQSNWKKINNSPMAKLIVISLRLRQLLLCCIRRET